MSQIPVPQDLRRFILTTVESVPYLEAMLLLRRESELPWDTRRLADRLFIGEKKAEGLLQALLAVGLLVLAEEPKSAYRYRPAAPELAAMVDRLAEFYASSLVEVTNLIHVTHDRSAEKFADAFIWRRKPDV